MEFTAGHEKNLVLIFYRSLMLLHYTTRPKGVLMPQYKADERRGVSGTDLYLNDVLDLVLPTERAN